MKKIEIKKLKKRSDIIESAYELFTTQGYENTSIMNIALKAGVGKGTFYLYFDSKEAVRDELIRMKASRILTTAVNHLDKYLSDTQLKVEPLDKIVLMADYIINYMKKDTALLRFVAKNLSWGLLAKDVDEPAEGEINFRQFTIDMLEKDNLKLRDPEIVIFTIIELVSSTCYSTIINNEPVDIETYKPYLYDNIRQIMANAIIK